MVTLHFPSDPLGFIVYLIGLIILWVVVSIPVYLGGRAVRGRSASFGEAMGATLGGVVVYYIVFFIVAIPLGAVIGPAGGAIALLLGFVAWLAVFKAAFHASWLGAVAIVLIAWLILLVLDFLLTLMFGVNFPKFFPF